MDIQHYRFGSITIDGRTYTNDIKIVDGRVKPEWWRKAGHSVEMADIQDVLAATPEVFVLGTGANGRVRVPEDFAKALAGRGIELIAEPTEKAVATFMRLVSSGKTAAAGFHLTC